MTSNRMLAFIVLAAALGSAGAAYAQRCTRQGNDISCDDGRRGVLEGGQHPLARRHTVELVAASQRHHRT
jgi:hypothetical protein